MSDTIIKVENLGKKYRIQHQQQGGMRYKALRDVITDKFKGAFKKLKLGKQKSGNQTSSPDSLSAFNFPVSAVPSKNQPSNPASISTFNFPVSAVPSKNQPSNPASISTFNFPVSAVPSSEDFWALKNVSFEVKRGEVVGIIGRNGAGKSTLLKILSRITEPTEGRVRLKGRVASLLEVGTGFHPELTGRENIFLNGAILGMTRAEIKRKFDEIVDFSGVEKFLDTPVKRYSSGMYVRLAFAVAAHLEPEILIVDEVLAVGDAEFQKKCMGKMKDVAGNGRTILFVSHNMSAIRSLCQTALLLKDGKVCKSGVANTVIESYLANLNENASLEMDLSAAPRAGHIGSQLRIHRLRINDGKGIWHGQPLNVEFLFECFDDVDEVSFGIGFSNRDGIRILSLDSDIPGLRWQLLRGQSGVVRLSVPQLCLEPDFYTLDVGSRSGDNAGLDYLPQCARVMVVPGEFTPPVIAMRESGRGGVRLPARWEMDRKGAFREQQAATVSRS